jgi:putative SOS response-associated peptidase YedK
MTMLYRLDAHAAAIARVFGAQAGDDPWAGGYVAPRSFAPVITAGREFVAGARPGRGPLRMVPRLWGVPPPPAADDPTRVITSVRNPESPFWIGDLRNSEFRCLVPATGFVEWGSGVDTEGRRERFLVTCPGQPLFAFAGLWKDSEVPGFAIVTSPPPDRLRGIGPARMPLVLPADPAAHEVWLHAGWDRASKLLTWPASQALEVRLMGNFNRA